MKTTIKQCNELMKKIAAKVNDLAKLTEGLSTTERGALGLLLGYYQPQYENGGIIQMIGHPVLMKGLVSDCQERCVNPLKGILWKNEESNNDNLTPPISKNSQNNLEPHLQANWPKEYKVKDIV